MNARDDIEHYDGHTIVYDQGPTSWGAYVEDLPVCFTVADTREQAWQQIREAIAGHLETLRQDMRDRPWLYESPITSYAYTLSNPE